MTGMSYVKQTETTAPRSVQFTSVSLGPPGASLTRRELVGPTHAQVTTAEETGSLYAPPSKLKSAGPRSLPKGSSAASELSKIPVRQSDRDLAAVSKVSAFVLHGTKAHKHVCKDVQRADRHLSPIVQHIQSRHATQAHLVKQQQPHSTPRSADPGLSQRRLKAMQLGVYKITETELKERYQFINEIGAGEWGSIWAVEALKPLEHLPACAYRLRQVSDSNADTIYTVDNSEQFRPLAVKLCKREGKYSSAARTKRLWNEFKVLRTLMDQLPQAEKVSANSPFLRVRNDISGWHPNVVSFYEFLLTPTLAMLAMPKYDEPMKVCLPETTCRAYFQQLLSAVKWLHQHCVCHNDIKVDNLLVTFDTSGLGRDTVTLVDFGFANRYDPALDNAFMSTDVWGTPEYLAPERIHGDLHDERRSDMWALGIAFFEMYTGRTPFERHDERFNSKEKFEEYYQRAGRGAWLGEWDLPPVSEDLIRKMLIVDPANRICAAEALLHSQFDPGLSSPCDSMDDLLCLPHDESFSHTDTELASFDAPREAVNGEDTSDTDDMFGEILTETDKLCLSFNESQSSLHASPGVGRAASCLRVAECPLSPTLSQVGMDSRLTNLMSASPPWKRRTPARQAIPNPVARRRQLFAEESVVGEQPGACVEALDETFASIDVLQLADDSGAVIATPTKEIPAATTKISPKTLDNVNKDCGKRNALHASACQDSNVSEGPKSTLHATASSRQLFRARGAAGSTVATLAKRFDSTSLLPLPVAQLARIKSEAQNSTKGLGHKRSKSCDIAKQPIERRSIRHSTGAKHLKNMVVKAPEFIGTKGMRARMLGEADVRQRGASRASTRSESSHTESTVDSVVLRTLNVGESPTSARSQVTATAYDSLDTVPPLRLAQRRARPASESSGRTCTAGGDEVVVSKLKKMASLASMLTRMIDETKSTMLSPTRLAFSSPKGPRSLAKCGYTASPAQSSVQEHGHEASASERRVDLVSASFSLDLSGAEQASLTQGKHSVVTSKQTLPPAKGLGQSGRSPEGPASASQVEGMYNSFLLSQNVAHVGQGYLLPTAPIPTTHNSVISGEKTMTASGPQSLASLFAVPSSPTFAHLLKKYGEPPKRQQNASEVGALPVTTTGSLGACNRSHSFTTPANAHNPAGLALKQHHDGDGRVIRQSVALDNATFEILNPSQTTTCSTVAIPSDDSHTTLSGSHYEVIEAASLAKADRTSIWTSPRQAKSERKAASSSGGRSKLSRLFRLVS